MSSSYIRLEQIFDKLNIINDTLSILHWDSSVKMPPGGFEARLEQVSYLNQLYYDLLVSNETIDLINSAQEDKNLADWQKSNLSLMHRAYMQYASVEKSLNTKFEEAASICEIKWREAKNQSDYNLVLPFFDRLVQLTKDVAVQKSKALNCSPYEAMLDKFNANQSSHQIDQLFGMISKDLPSIIDQVLEKQNAKKTIFSSMSMEIQIQKTIATKIMQELGFDFNHGRLDESAHPFCGGINSDVRITSRYQQEDLVTGIYGVIHETGHALYEQNLPTKWAKQPVGKALGMSIHESQSLLYEMQIGRSKEFIAWLCSFINGLHITSESLNFEQLYSVVNKVKRDFIRLDADEVTYPMHVIMRYNIEKKIINNEINVKDLPEIWAEESRKALKIKPDNDKIGCLQDIHWYMGMFGYFPSYCLGALNAAQIYDAMKREISNIGSQISNGQFKEIKNWLHLNIHSNASRYSANELIKKCTGNELDASIFFRYIKHKYLED